MTAAIDVLLTRANHPDRLLEAASNMPFGPIYFVLQYSPYKAHERLIRTWGL
jgi:hypothetical protein